MIKQKLSRTDMEATIAAGRCVLFKGRVITSVGDLPTAADLAETPADADAALRRLDEEEQRIAAERRKLTGRSLAEKPYVPTMREMVSKGYRGDALKQARDYDADAAEQLVAAFEEWQKAGTGGATQPTVTKPNAGQSEPAAQTMKDLIAKGAKTLAALKKASDFDQATAEKLIADLK